MNGLVNSLDSILQEIEKYQNRLFETLPIDFKNGELRNEIYIKLENFHICRSKDFMTNLYSRTIFFYLDFLSQVSAIHRREGKRRGIIFIPLYRIHPLTNG